MGDDKNFEGIFHGTTNSVDITNINDVTADNFMHMDNSVDYSMKKDISGRSIRHYTNFEDASKRSNFNMFAQNRETEDDDSVLGY